MQDLTDAPEPQLEDRGEIRRMHLGPDDTLVVRYDHRIRPDALAFIAARLRDIFGEDQKILVLDHGADVDVLTPDEVA